MSQREVGANLLLVRSRMRRLHSLRFHIEQPKWHATVAGSKLLACEKGNAKDQPNLE